MNATGRRTGDSYTVRMQANDRAEILGAELQLKAAGFTVTDVVKHEPHGFPERTYWTVEGARPVTAPWWARGGAR